MTVAASSKSITSTASRVDTAADADAKDGGCIYLRNSGAQVVYIGASNVTDTTGFPIPATTTLAFDLDLAQSEALYAVCAAGESSTLKVLETGL